MNDAQRLAKLLTAEQTLKKTTRGYTPTGVFWRTGMPLLWEVRQSLGTDPKGKALAEAHGLLKKTEKGYDPRAPRWREAMLLIDAVEEGLRPSPIPPLGPVLVGGKSLLLESPTHDTDGLFGNPRCPDPKSHWAAFDFGWKAGLTIVAPETWKVIQQSSAQGADACYLEGLDSQILYWLGHIVTAPSTGRVIKKGERTAVIAAIPGADHGHLGVNVRPLTGGVDLTWGKPVGRDYTFGGPTIGQQLAAILAA